jgi:calmodulin
MAHRAKFAFSKPKEFTPQEVEDLRSQFRIIDQDADGRASREELAQFSKTNGIEPRFVNLAFIVFDGDKNGGLQFEEYLDFIEIAKNFDRDKRSFFKRVFDALDKDKSGAIDGQELQVLCTAFGYEVSVKEATAIVKSMDYTGTGKLILDDFLHWLGLPRQG